MATPKPVAAPRFILKRTMHLGCIRQSFSAGAIMQKVRSPEGNETLFIDGKPFNDTRDFDILERHGWVEPFSPEKHAAYIQARSAAKPASKIKLPEKKKSGQMEVIESDSDLNEDIDISHTKTPKKIAKDKKAALEVIKGDGIEDVADETPEERVARMQTEIPKMQIVEDDSLGADGRPSLNAGTVKSISPEEAAKKKADATRRAEAYKVELAKRKAAADAAKKAANEVEASSTVTVTQTDFGLQTVEQAATEEATGESEGIEIEQLGGFEKATGPETVTAAPKKGRGRPKGSKNKAAAPAAN